MKVNALLNNFSGGEVSPRIWARPDVTKVKNGLKTSENAIIVTHGGAYKRPGTQFVIELPDTTDHVLIPFQYSTEQSYTLIFGNNYIWFCKDKGIITHAAKTITGITQANPAVVTSASHGFSNGDKVYIISTSGMDEVNNRWFTVANVATNTFELSGVDSSSYDAYTSGGTAGEIVELATTYTTAQLPTLQTTNINDVLYITHGSHKLRKLSRTSDTVWTLGEPDITTGPFRTINDDSTLTLTPSSFSASATAYGTHEVGETFTLTAASAYFDSDMVGGLFRIFEEGGGSGIVGAPIGGSNSLDNGDVYTYQGNVYGVNNLSGASTWTNFTRVPEHTSGAVRVTAGSAYFDANFLHPGYCIVRITAFTSSTVVTAEIVRYQMPEAVVSNGSSFWEEGAWSDYRGYPNAIALYEQRLWLGGASGEPTAIWGSRSGAYEDFEDGAEDDDAVAYRLSSGMADVIRWMSGRRVLTAGTSQGEYAISASSQNEAITPDNIKAVLQSDAGTSSVLPITINQAVIYPQRRGDPDNASLKVREFFYQFNQDAFTSVDLTIFSEHIFGEGLVRLAYQREPESLLWGLRTDGTLACCTYEREQEVVPWHRHEIAGTDAVAKALAVKPGDEGDEVWLQVNRTIDGGTVAYVEVMSQRFRENETAKEDCQNVDCSLVYSGSALDQITGFWHLRGETVDVLVNGYVDQKTITSTGKLNFDTGTDATKASVGYAYETVLHLQEFEGGAEAGTAQSRKKRISRIFLKLLDSLGGTVGTDTSDQQEIKYRVESDPMDASPPLRTEYVDVPIGNSGWGRDKSVMIRHSDPLPFFVVGCVAEQSVTD